MVDPAAAAVVAGALLVGASLNSLVGFGFALVTVPVMALAVGPKDAVVLSALLGLLSNSGVAWRHRADVERAPVGRMVGGSLVGMPVGALVLGAIADGPLQVGISVAVLAAVVVLVRGWTLTDPHPAVDVGAGFVQGVLNTSVGVSGPPVIADLQGRRLPKGPFRASTAMVFALTGPVALGLFAVAGRITGPLLVLAAVVLPAWPVGTWVGGRLHHRFPEERFRVLVLSLLVATALVTLVSGLAASIGDAP